MQASEFQDTAERLAQGTTEGDWRSAISRAYYAVFHHFLDFFLSHGLDLGRGGQAHILLYHGLNNCGCPTVVPVADVVNDLRRARGKADYELTGTIDQTTAVDTVQVAQSIVDNFQNQLTTLAPVDIVDGVRNYLQASGRLPKP